MISMRRGVTIGLIIGSLVGGTAGATILTASEHGSPATRGERARGPGARDR